CPECLCAVVRGDRTSTASGEDACGAAHGEYHEAASDTTGLRPERYSHSIVAGGFDVTSRTTRLTPGISFTMRAEIVSTRSSGRRAASAVTASSCAPARTRRGWP